VASNHCIGNAGDLRDLRRDRTPRIFQPFPRAEDFVDPSALPVILKQADPESDDFVAIGVNTSGLDIHDGGDELWNIIGWMVFGQSP